MGRQGAALIAEGRAMLRMRGYLVALWVVVLCCHALSTEVQELSDKDLIKSDAEAKVSEKQTKDAIDTAERKEAMKQTMKAYKEAFGTNAVLKGEDKLAWSKEKKSMMFVKGLKKEVEQFTGKKVKAKHMHTSAPFLKNTITSSHLHNLIRQMGKAEKKSLGKKNYKKL